MRPSARTPLLLPTFVIGVGLSGFFDGILLHQVLQWHHLLSLVPGEPFRDIGTQILADGAFHVFMYAITAWGLWLLWHRRSALNGQGVTSLAVAGGGLLGFGVWNVIDVGFFHWILGIHRIRVNVDNPMMYDVAWLVALGVLPLAVGLALLKRDGGATGGGKSAAVGMGCLAIAGGAISSMSFSNSQTTLVLIAPGASIPVMNAAIGADARLLWADPRGRMMVVSLGPAAPVMPLYDSGALLVTRSPILAGCVTASS